jgi:hypothetical protein
VLQHSAAFCLPSAAFCLLLLPDTGSCLLLPLAFYCLLLVAAAAADLLLGNTGNTLQRSMATTRE